MLLAAVFKNSGISEYCGMLKAKKARKTRKTRMDAISHSETSLLGKFYMHHENVPFMTKNVNVAFFPWTFKVGHT